MAKYRLLIKTSAAKELAAISRKKDRQRLVAKIETLSEEPRPEGCKKLSGAERYRVRQGPYRIVYEIQDDQLVVCIVKLGDRKSIYRAL